MADAIAVQQHDDIVKLSTISHKKHSVQKKKNVGSHEESFQTVIPFLL